MFIRLTILVALALCVAAYPQQPDGNTCRRVMDGYQDLYSAYFKLQKPCRDECQPWYDYLRKDGKYYGPAPSLGEKEPDGTYAINMAQHCSNLDIAMPCQVCIGNKTFGPIFKDELHNTTQANEAGLPNDGMLYLITRCRQSGYATPKSMDRFPNIWPDKQEQRRIDVGSKCRPEIVGCFDGVNCSDIIDHLTGKPYDNARRPGDGSENVPTNASAIVYNSTSSRSSVSTNNASASATNSTPQLPVLPTTMNKPAPSDSATPESGALPVSIPLTFVLGALGVSSLL